MSGITEQTEKWVGQFGREYTDRNASSLEGMETLSKSDFGKTRSDQNEQFLQGVDRSARILEVGCNIGNQLLCLQRMGFNDLWGIDIQEYALGLAMGRTDGINFALASALDIPFEDGSFDLVFTSGLLIHIGPSDILRAMAEIRRCSRSYIWGSEHYADEDEEILYRGHRNLLWNRNFVRLYLDSFSGLSLINEVLFPCLGGDDMNTMFLLKKAR